MRKNYIFLLLFWSILQISIAHNTNGQQALSNILALELESEIDFTIYNDSINSNRSILSPDDLIFIYQKAVDQSKQIKNDSLFFHYSGLLDYTNVTLTDYDEAIKVSKVCIDHATAIKDTLEMVLWLSKMGSNYFLKDSMIISLDYTKRAFNLAKNYGDQSLTNWVSTHLSNKYKSIGREEDAIALLMNSIANYKGKESEEALHMLVYNYTILSGIELRDSIGNINIIDELEKVVQQAENHKDFGQNNALKAGCSQAYYVLFNYYVRKKSNLEKGEYYYQKLLNAESTLESYKYLASFLYAIANKDLATAKQFIKKENEDIHGEPYMLHALEYYKLTGDVEKQLYYTNLLKDEEIENLKADKVNLNNFTNLQLENIDNLKEVAKLQQGIESENLKKRYFIFIALLLGTLLALSLFSFLQIRKRSNLLKEQNVIIEQQAIKLQASMEQKSTFFTNVAHEFQTPLSIITGLAKKVKSFDKIEDVKSLLPIIIRNGTQLSEFTSQILELTKNEETFHTLDESYFYIDELVQYQIHELQYLADSKNIKIHFENPLNKRIIFSDAYKLKTIIKNLVSNAIKFSPLNSEVNLNLHALDKKNIKITISDNGKGISKEDLATIFDRFYQSNNDDKSEGFGIGLAICKEYSMALGGQIDVQSTLGKGSQFELHIPANVNGEVIDETLIQRFTIVESSEEIPLPTQSNKDKSILILEDNIDFCKYLSSILSSKYQLSFAHNGYDALTFLKKNTPDLIITDWMLPEMDGLEFIKKLNDTLSDIKIPVLMLTARSLLTDQLKALKEGVGDYLLKTVDEKILIQRIEHMLVSSNNGVSQPFQLNGNGSLPIHQIIDNISKQDQEWLLQFEETILPKIHEFNLNVDVIADLMNMSSSHLFRKMKSIAGISPKKYIQELRFWEARRILELKLVDSVKAACFSVGFKDPKNFSKNFKEKFDKYPSDFLN